jgi:hypothetical protein
LTVVELTQRMRPPEEALAAFFLILLNRSRRLRSAGVDKTVRAKANASDHAPSWIVLK